MEELSKRRLERCRFVPTGNLESNPSNNEIEIDSDFGEQANAECYSLSF